MEFQLFKFIDQSSVIYSISAQFGEIAEKIEQRAAENWESIAEDFCSKLSVLMVKSAELQNRQKLDAVRYITISFLRSSAVTASSDFQISAWDKGLFISEYPAVTYWSPDFIFQDIGEEIQGLYNTLRDSGKKPLSEWERKEYDIYVRTLYFTYALGYCQNLMEYVDPNDWKEPQMEKTLEILFGPYRDKNRSIAKFVWETM